MQKSANSVIKKFDNWKTQKFQNPKIQIMSILNADLESVT